MPGKLHQFYAVAFQENFVLKELARLYPAGRLTLREIKSHCGAPGGDGEVFLYPFGAVVFHDVAQADRLAEIKRLSESIHLTTRVVREDFVVREAPEDIGVRDGQLVVDRLEGERTSVVALTVAQSAAMEYYETIVETMFVRTKALVDRLEHKGTVSMSTRPLHRFIGESISTRSEVLSVLYLLDKPDATWDDPAMDHIYNDLRAEFDLVDRYQSLESKLRSVQEALELILDVARDRRMITLEVVLGLLFAFEVALELYRR